jgi:prepilin-type N-terminal cleavage/methylation domain-containing protein
MGKRQHEFLFLRECLRHGRPSPGAAGFTLIELLVTLIIIGILSAIALRSYLNEANRAREVEALVTLRDLNQQQMLHFLEFHRFATQGMAIAGGDAGNYSFAVTSTDATQAARAMATPQRSDLRGYVSLICVDGDHFWVKTYRGLVNQVPTVDEQTCTGVSQTTPIAVAPSSPPTTKSLQEICDPSLTTVPNPGTSTGTPPGLGGKNPKGIQDKTIYGWEVAPGLNKVIVPQGCN